jgi:autotransporter-associated beta strand protein
MPVVRGPSQFARRAVLVTAAAGGYVSLGTPTFATTFSWNRTSTSVNWNVALNWGSPDGGTPPPPLVPPVGQTTHLVFGGTQTDARSIQAGGDYTLDSMTFGSTLAVPVGTSSFAVSTLAGGSADIALGGGGITSTSGNASINFQLGSATSRRMILTANQTWSVNASINGGGTVTMNRPIAGNFMITKAGTGALVLTASNATDWTGGLQIDQGSVRLQSSADAIGSGPVVVNTANDVSLFAGGIGPAQVIAGPVALGGAGVFALGGTFAFTFSNAITLLNDKAVQVSTPTTLNGALAGAFRLTKTGASTLTLNPANTHNGFDVRGGNLVVSSDGQLGAVDAFVGLGSSVPPGGSLITGTLRATAALASTRNINILDTDGGSIDTNGHAVTFGDVAGAGAFSKIGMNVLTVNHVRTNALTVSAGTVRIASNGTATGTSRVNSLSLAGGTTPTATLDLANNGAVVDYPAADAEPLDTLRAQIIHAYHAGAWDQPGITSSGATASTHGVGYAEASALFTSFPATFVGQEVDSTAVLLRLVPYGDANLDGSVGLPDFNRLAGGFGSTSAVWSVGDFNYDGSVTLQDFNRLAGNFGISASPGGPTPQDWANLAAAIPEPGAAALLGSAFLARRRRRN